MVTMFIVTIEMVAVVTRMRIEMLSRVIDSIGNQRNRVFCIIRYQSALQCQKQPVDAESSTDVAAAEIWSIVTIETDTAVQQTRTNMLNQETDMTTNLLNIVFLMNRCFLSQ